MSKLNKSLVDVKSTQYSLNDGVHTTDITLADDTHLYIFIERGMIFVADCNLTELTRRIDAGDIDSYEAYDTSDGISYFLDSDYAPTICDSLLNLSNRLL